MFNSQRIESIRKNIQLSTLLTDKEKSDWLNLLDLMNEKQLGELEEILATEAPALNFTEQQAPIAPPSPTKGIDGAIKPAPGTVQHMPPLSHLANVPSNVSLNPVAPPQPIPIPQTTPAPPSPSYPKPRQKPTPMARPTPSPNLSVPPRPTLQKPIEQPPARILNPLPSATQPSSTAVSPSSQQPMQGQGTYSIQQVEDLQLLSPQTLRTMSQQSIFNTIKSVIAVNGYFTVLQLIESSPLYVAYIRSGNIRLGVQPNAEDLQAELTQEEFEFVTDLLRNMRFNRW